MGGEDCVLYRIYHRLIEGGDHGGRPGGETAQKRRFESRGNHSNRERLKAVRRLKKELPLYGREGGSHLDRPPLRPTILQSGLRNVIGERKISPRKGIARRPSGVYARAGKDSSGLACRKRATFLLTKSRGLKSVRVGGMSSS